MNQPGPGRAAHALFAQRAQQLADQGKAHRLLASLYPGRQVIQLDIDAIAAGGGGIHCVTHQQPGL
ncbi:conserved hypothetical protein [Pseudomonas protegens Pf-5]|uniref:Agmatine deiminase n=1 Tax=Pseudomonas fluorescens (strain ATCC BAA-477 / NRRL B-23932 / Pf-5) TaxID=220664 RepID=Q4KDY9_PSEF5|nr:conserved hypothetical protein [Pseudomonas protegens Pf-5]